MFPRNSATPPRVAVGAVVQISDGVVQTSGVLVVVRPEGGAEAAGGGTITYGATSDVVYYTPTQAETDYVAFAVVAYKTGCIPVSVTIVTTSSQTSGTVLLAPVSQLVGTNLASQASVDAVPTASEIKDQVLDVLTVDTFPELTGVPAATSSMLQKLTYIFMWFRNKSEQTSTTRVLKADDTTTTVATEAISDNGITYTKDEAS